MRDGLVVVDKEAGWTSHDVVGKLRGVYGQRRIGHAGTLDPGATGVLLVGLGRVTRLMRFLQEGKKVYDARVAFGIATDTLDAAGAVLEQAEMSFTRRQLEDATRAFIGDIDQVPPMVSAIKVGGRKLYELARRGEEIERAPRRVRIDAIEVNDLTPGPYPEASVTVTCGSGTYIRSLAADLGSALGGCAHLGALRRLAIGSFTTDEAHPIGVIERDPSAFVLSPAEAMRDLDPVVVDDETARAVAHGATFAAQSLVSDPEAEGPFAVHDRAGTLLAVYERRGAGVKPAVVCAS